jgi:hypothetical protein
VARIGTADAHPTKSFFVRMITRDIALQDCILDLIDNSIDGAWDLCGSRPTGLTQHVDLSPYHIEIKLSANEFSIRDNCGGISLRDATEYAFTFGRDDEDEETLEEQKEDYSIGVYGIGMKRAAFKIGRKITVRSTAKANGKGKIAFQVPIDVQTWIRSDVWDFPINDDEPLREEGVLISVKDLNDGARSSFADDGFILNLRQIIARDYTLHLHYGLRVSVNGKPVRGWRISMLSGGDFEPLRDEFDESYLGGSVKVELVCGMAAPPPDSDDPDDTIDEEERYGWYVACNGRIVLAADKSTVSGWGTDGWPQWHGQYNGFIGLVFFSSKDTSLLPLTTTKRSIETTSEIFRRIQPRMRAATRAWTSYTNIRKSELGEAKRLEAQAKPTPIFNLKMAGSVSLPKLTRTPKEPVANIAYSVPLERAYKMGEALGNRLMPYRTIGKETFEFAFKKLVGAR